MRLMIQITSAATTFLLLSSMAFGGTILRTNEVRIALGSIDQKAPVSFLVQRHSVTDGQPFETKDNTLLPASVARLDSQRLETTMEILSGRHKSRKVYDDLLTWGVMPASLPTDEMNFAVEGTLVLKPSPEETYTCEHVVLSQTGHGLRNPWYILSTDGNSYSWGTYYTKLNCFNKDKIPKIFKMAKSSQASNVFYVWPLHNNM